MIFKGSPDEILFVSTFNFYESRSFTFSVVVYCLNNRMISHYVKKRRRFYKISIQVIYSYEFFLTNVSVMCAIVNYRTTKKSRKRRNFSDSYMTFCLDRLRIPGSTKNSESRSHDATVYCTVVY